MSARDALLELLAFHVLRSLEDREAKKELFQALEAFQMERAAGDEVE